ncbi:hypothetical protein WJX74_007195 [Apatococcus lobatus]|uniref:Acyl-coenzyme A oxidase n=1 Tax=Apatococcus lobatus TaxID=904363 RepID=A0AAW1QYG1_9CHLO
MAAQRRVAALTRQLTSAPAELEGFDPVPAVSDVVGETDTAFDPRKLYEFITRDNIQLRDAAMEFMQDDLYKPNYYQGLMDFREQTLQRLQKFVDQRYFQTMDYLKNPRKFMAGLEVLALCDYSLAIKAGVHFTLCGGTICKLGTAKHHEKYLPGLDSLELPGCFGMTELGHGSNVLGIETQAVFDKDTGEFVIHTPTDTASKFWIGGSAQHGKVCTVFAQLTVNGKWEGPHVFVVRLRDDQGRLNRGVRIRDNGPKMGLNGVDNGQIWFEHVRIPRDALLNRFADVAADGTYSSPFPTVGQRFGVTVGGLTTGRMLIAGGGIDASKIGVCIAIAYACQRPQFGSRYIMEYLTHQRRLVPALATCYAMHFTLCALKDIAFSPKPDAKAVHVLSSGLKAAATWNRVEILQDCRECCGGQGFSAENKIGPMKTDFDVDTTFEGDNTVLMQQVAKALLESAAKSKSKPQQPALGPGQALTPASIQQLLQFRQDALVAQIGGEMQQASQAAASTGGKAAAAAANSAFDANLDLVVALGWAHMEARSHQIFQDEVAQAPQQLQAPLRSLALLFGLSRVERNAAFYLSQNALSRPHFQAVRLFVNETLSRLSSNGGETLLRLCAGFGIPDHLIQAPIAFDWRCIGRDL